MTHQNEKEEKERQTGFLDGIKKSVIVRILMIGFLIMILLIPTAMIYSIINEREARKNSVITEINSRWASTQTLTGPVLEVPYFVHMYSRIIENGHEKQKVVKKKKTAYFLPDELIITGTLFPETRYRGIYQSTVYTADLEIKGRFAFPGLDVLRISDEDIVWDEVLLTFGISDMRGINKKIELEWNQTQLDPKPGLRNREVFFSGINADVTIDGGNRGDYEFDMKLNLRGSGSIHFQPFGKKTDVHLSSTWKSPSFSGAFLPKKRDINEEGFKAYWEVLDYNREFPQWWTKWKWNLHNSSFGVDLYTPVDEYQKTTRSIKYSVLFISLTFLAFFVFFELFNNRRIHPIQYLLVGSALCVFYLLLISLSEHFSFSLAYLISSLFIVGLTTVYIKSISRKWRLTGLMGLVIAGLYGFLYVMLRLEDYALLMGSMGIFAILGAIMLGTRKIDWYSFRIERSE